MSSRQWLPNLALLDCRCDVCWWLDFSPWISGTPDVRPEYHTCIEWSIWLKISYDIVTYHNCNRRGTSFNINQETEDGRFQALCRQEVSSKLCRLRQLAEGLPGSGWVQPQDVRVLLRCRKPTGADRNVETFLFQVGCCGMVKMFYFLDFR